MSKNAYFTGQPIFSQLVNLIPSSIISQSVMGANSDHYYKKFKSMDHLVSMLYCIFHKCTSIREVVTGMQVCGKKLSHVHLKHLPRRTTLSDANRDRNQDFFQLVYQGLYSKYAQFLSDSRKTKTIADRLFIVDSTTITLFKEILKNAGRQPANGKRKGGIKVHTLMNARQDVPCLIEIKAAASHDVPFLKKINLPEGSILVFDKGYVDYQQYQRLKQEKVDWVTRLREGASYQIIAQKTVTDKQLTEGVQTDQIVMLGHTSHKQVTRVKARLIQYYDDQSEKLFSFITSNMSMKASTIALIYKKRWQIETLFKRIKQNFPLQYFLGDNENAIRIQIWCGLIADLLIKVIKAGLKRSWSFANLASMIRIHLMTYISIQLFLENPDDYLIKDHKQHQGQLSIFDSS